MKTNKLTTALKLSMFLLILFTSGCYYDEVYVAPPEGEISYSTDMQPFFDAKCTSCHNGTGAPLNLNADVSYDALISGGYINTTDPAGSSLYTKIDAGGSMEAYASDNERGITLKWIEQGANNN
jgi:hypothetical protein